MFAAQNASPTTAGNTDIYRLDTGQDKQSHSLALAPYLLHLQTFLVTSLHRGLMGAYSQDAGRLAVLREVVGRGPSDDALVSALRQSGGDLAAAANIILDAPAVK